MSVRSGETVAPGGLRPVADGRSSGLGEPVRRRDLRHAWKHFGELCMGHHGVKETGYIRQSPGTAVGRSRPFTENGPATQESHVPSAVGAQPRSSEYEWKPGDHPSEDPVLDRTRLMRTCPTKPRYNGAEHGVAVGPQRPFTEIVPAPHAAHGPKSALTRTRSWKPRP